MKLNSRKYVIITGGVISGLGKGVTAASIGMFFSDELNVVPIKLDGYLNTDPGTMNPIEHGEVFVLDDGCEADMDFGHYERFLGNSCSNNQSITMGRIFDNIRQKERRGDYLGKTVQMVPHVTDNITENILRVAEQKDADIVFVEVGGTVGDMENELYIQAVRGLKQIVGEENICYLHLSYVPIPTGVDEQKTKPTQQSTSLLHSKGVWPDFILCRCEEELKKQSINKIAQFGNIKPENVITLIDVDDIYKVPFCIDNQNFIFNLCKKLNINYPKKEKYNLWNNLISQQKNKKINLTIAGKYTGLEDSYASVVEAIKHASYHLNCRVEISWLDTSSEIDYENLSKTDAIIVPGGFGTRGIEGKIKVIEFARTNKIPLLGICYGLQLCVIEYLRNVCGIVNASSLELGCDPKNAAVTILESQKNIKNLGGTMRLGSYRAKLEQNSIMHELYSKFNLIDSENIVSERHRHRYEINPDFIDIFTSKNLLVSGFNPESNLVEFIELDKNIHPYFVGCQAHPELKSKLERPSPMFYGLIDSAIKNQENKNKNINSLNEELIIN